MRVCKCKSVRMCDSLLLLGENEKKRLARSPEGRGKGLGGGGGDILMKAGVKEIQWRNDQV